MSNKVILDIGFPINVPINYKIKWNLCFDGFMFSYNKNLIIFLAETLEILDSGNKCNFFLNKINLNIFEKDDQNWSLKSKNFEIYREVKIGLVKNNIIISFDKQKMYLNLSHQTQLIF